MRRTEIIKILGMLSIEHKNLEPSEERVSLWFELFGHVDFNLAIEATKLILLKLKFEPRAADFAEALQEVSIPEDYKNDASYAWSLAASAVARAYSGDSEAIIKLPTPIQEAVRKIGAYEIKHSQNPQFLKNDFSKIYQQIIKEKKESVLVGAKNNLKLINNEKIVREA